MNYLDFLLEIGGLGPVFGIPNKAHQVMLRLLVHGLLNNCLISKKPAFLFLLNMLDTRPPNGLQLRVQPEILNSTQLKTV